MKHSPWRLGRAAGPGVVNFQRLIANRPLRPVISHDESLEIRQETGEVAFLRVSTPRGWTSGLTL